MGMRWAEEGESHKNLSRRHQTTSTRPCEQLLWLPQEITLLRQLLWELLRAVFFAATHPTALYLNTWVKRLSFSLILVLRWGILPCYNIPMPHLRTSVIRNHHLVRAWERERWEYWEVGGLMQAPDHTARGHRLHVKQGPLHCDVISQYFLILPRSETLQFFLPFFTKVLMNSCVINSWRGKFFTK